MALFKHHLAGALLWLLTALISGALAAQNTDQLPPFESSRAGLLFTLQGSNTIGAELAPQLVRDYLKAKGLINVEIQPRARENEYRIVGYRLGSSQPIYVDLAAHGSSTGFKGLINGSADIAMSSRPIKATEVQALKNLGNMQSFEAEKVVAIDGLAIIVHPANPIYKLTIDQIRQLFSGEIDNWLALGGENRKVTLYARDNNSGTWDTFKHLVLGKSSLLSPRAKRFESNDDLSAQVQADHGAIGFVGLAAVGGAQVLSVADNNTRALLPTQLSVATEDYPLSRRLYLYASPHNNEPILREFLRFTQGLRGQQRVQKVGYISQNPISVPPPKLDHAPQQYRELVQHAQRLSVNIRFQTGSARLDNKARQDILRLAQFMESAENRGKEILLIGFGDAKQSAQRALVLSKLRAIAVKAALRDLGLSTRPVEGVGATMPVADNRSASRLKNQRVEVWLI